MHVLCTDKIIREVKIKGGFGNVSIPRPQCIFLFSFLFREVYFLYNFLLFTIV